MNKLQSLTSVYKVEIDLRPTELIYILAPSPTYPLFCWLSAKTKSKVNNLNISTLTIDKTYCALVQSNLSIANWTKK